MPASTQQHEPDMLRTYTKKEILAAWRRRQGLTSGWAETPDDVLAEIEESAFTEIEAAYANLLQSARAELVNCENFPAEELNAEVTPEGIRLILPVRCGRPLEIEMESGHIITRFPSPSETIPSGLLTELTGGVKSPVAERTGNVIRITAGKGDNVRRLYATASPSGPYFILSPSLLPSLFDNTNLSET